MNDNKSSMRGLITGVVILFSGLAGAQDREWGVHREIVHGAKDNKHTARRRAALSIRYLGDDVRWDPREGTDPIVNQDLVGISPGEPPRNDKWFPRVWSAG